MGGYFLCGPRISTSLLARQNAVAARPLIFMGQRISHPMEVRRQLVVAQRISISPILQVITSSRGSMLVHCWLSRSLPGQTCRPPGRGAGTAASDSQNRVRAGPPHPLRLLGCIVMQHAQGALIGVTLRIVRGGKTIPENRALKQSRRGSSSPAASTATQTRALSAGMLATPDRWASARPSAAGLSDTTLIRGASRRPNLRFAFPAGVTGQRILALHLVGRSKTPRSC